MKKLFVILAVASLGFVACNNDSNSTEDAAKLAADSTRVADSLAAVKKAADSAAAAMDTMHKAAMDTAAKK